MSLTATFDPSDLFRFAPFAFKQATLKSFLMEKEGISWKRKYFVLFGNLLFKFETDDASKLLGIEFLEYANCRNSAQSTDANTAMTISTVGGKSI